MNNFTKGDGVSVGILLTFMTGTSLWNTIARKEKNHYGFCRVVLITLVANKQPYHSELVTNTFSSSKLCNNYSFLASLWSKIYSTAPQIITDDKLDDTFYLLVLMLRAYSVLQPFHIDVFLSFLDVKAYDEPCRLFSPGV